MADALERNEEYLGAISAYKEAMTIYKEHDDLRNIALIHDAKGQVYFYLKQFEKATQKFEKAIAGYKTLQDWRNTVVMLLKSGKVYLEQLPCIIDVKQTLGADGNYNIQYTC